MVCPPTKSAFPPCTSYFSMLTFHRDMYSAGITLIWPTHHRLLFINKLTPIVHRPLGVNWPKWRYHNRLCGLSVLAGYLWKDLVNMHFLKKKKKRRRKKWHPQISIKSIFIFKLQFWLETNTGQSTGDTEQRDWILELCKIQILQWTMQKGTK